MTEPTLHTLTRRLDRLEREAMGWRIAGIVVAAILLFVGASPQSPVADKLVARESILVDQLGHQRARLMSGPDATSAFLGFKDQQGKLRAGVGLFSTGDPHVFLADPHGTARVALGFLPDGTPGFFLKDALGKARIALNVGPDGLPGLNLQDEQEKGLVGLLVGRDGLPGLLLRDARGTLRASLEVDASGAGLALLDETRTMRAVLGAVPIQNPKMGTLEMRSESSVALFGKDGKVIWKVP